MTARTYKGIENLLKRRSLEMTTLYEVSKILGSSIDTKVTVNSALRVLSNFLGLEKSSIAEYSQENKNLKITFAYGYTKDEVKNTIIKLGEGPLGRAAKTGTPAVITENPTIFAIPIKDQNKLFGIFSVERQFSSEKTVGDDLKFLAVIASMLSQAIHLSRDAERRRKKLIKENVELREQLEKKSSIEGIIGISPQMEKVFEIIKHVAPTNSTVLLRGESGTGKEIVARAIHSLSKRQSGPFIKVNCPAIPETLLESELFGHERGAFTGATEMRKGRFELAHNGTILLDEIGDLGFAMQSKMLRFLQENTFERVGSSRSLKVDVRVIAATNRELEDLIKENKFRKDLYYRLNVVPIYLPPLRERKEDIALLAENFLKNFNNLNDKSVKLTEGALAVLINYPWPGNIRELENCIERLVVLSKSNIVDSDELPLPVAYNPVRFKPSQKTSDSQIETRLDGIERNAIMQAMRESDWVQKEASKKLGISPRQLNYKLKKYKIVKTYKNV
ncbi:MAG TPA: sigma 54-interacting transcriptional regulator [bacterium]